jgi:CubicO group peptidase (beta-lactamase class C family)
MRNIGRRGLLAGGAAAALARPSLAAGQFWPGTSWEPVTREGWDEAGLAVAKAYADSIGTATFAVVQRGRLVVRWGDIDQRLELHSMRKSLLSALIGIAVARGQIDLDATLARLGIDDVAPSLSDVEKQATVRQLLQARSGVYHPALYETAGMARRRPARGSHAPGTFWYYNNWDFNTLGTIYERAVGRSIFAAFAEEIAAPLQMQDYRVQDGRYVRGEDMSLYPAYPFHMSARDLARFGLLYARGGVWQGRQHDGALGDVYRIGLWLSLVDRVSRPAGGDHGFAAGRVLGGWGAGPVHLRRSGTGFHRCASDQWTQRG